MSLIRSLLRASSPYLGLAAVFAIACAFSPVRDGWPVFLQVDNLMDIVRQVSVRGILAVGMTFVIISGGIDLSVGAVLAMATVLSALALDAWGMGAAGAILLPCLAGMFLGWFNGFFVAKSGVQPFIVTLAAMSIARGVAMALSRNYTIPVPSTEHLFLLLEKNLFGWLPAPALIFLLTVAVFEVVLRRTSYGRHVYAIGGNETAARLAGVPVDRCKVITYALCGFLAAAAGVLQTAQMRQGDPKEGVAFELDAIAAVVVGGASLMGGKGRVVGALAGSLLIGIILNVLGLRNVEPSVQKMVIGALLLFAVSMQSGRWSMALQRFNPSASIRSWLVALLVVLPLTLSVGCGPSGDVQYVIGFSQCNNAEPWRQAMNDAARAEAAKHPELQLIFQDAEQRNDRQISQVRLLLRQGVDLLIISPNEAAPLTPVVEEAFDAGVPVVVLDRAVNTDKYTSFIGADNREIGRRAGEYIAETLGGEGRVVEIRGLPGSPPAIDRSEGFREIIHQYPGIEIIHDPVANWLRREAIDQMRIALQAHPRIDLVYAHNDPMALGARLAAEQMG